ncbi:unnamed protein product [Symbiodinium pilosum]|uniref:Uncharacterized protein n=1 Tax=Symbiodinium pilosum TaxID=2952 RepID=A0A812T4H9_SYMPI|nr:unnamed protein product [Symbiodinium pilosum]
MWRPDPGPCVAQVADWGEHPDDVEYIRQLKAVPKKILKRREIVAKDLDIKRVCQKQGKVHFSVACWNLSEYSRSGGLDAQASSLIHVFYEGKDERKVLNVFSSAGIELESAEAVPVDPNSSKRHEQQIMYAKECLYIQDENTWEEGQPLSPDEAKQRFQGRMKA